MFKSELAYNNWKSKYRYGNEEPLDTFKRVAKALASVEKDPEKWEEVFLKTLVKFDLSGEALGLKCTPGGRITANIGTSYKHATLLNCFSGDTEYLDLHRGLVKFSDMVGQLSTVLTDKGPEEAKIEYFGVQKTCEVLLKPAYLQFRHINEKGLVCRAGTPGSIQREYYYCPGKSDYKIKIKVTPDHRWILDGGIETTQLKIGDVVESMTPSLSPQILDEYKAGRRHGLIFGDGSISYVYTDAINSTGKYGQTRYSVRLCGEKIDNLEYFDTEEIRYHPSCNGEPTCYYTSNKKLKEIPGSDESISYLRGFVDGLIATDGSHWYKDREIYEVSTTSESLAEWLEKNAFIAGYIVTGLRVDSDIETNFGKRNKPVIRITLTKEVVKWKVYGIIDGIEQDVFCAVVPNRASFTLSRGVYTGNCFISGPVSNATIKYHRQSDEGKVGYDVEYTTDNTPDDLTNIFLSVLEQAKTLATEGGYGINFSFIRPRGSLIKGIGIKHPGVLAYMDVWDEVSNCIVRGTNDGYMDKLKNYLKDEEIEDTKTAVKAMARKGAMMAVLDCSHPDIEEFVRAKQESGRLTKFNMSVLISDEFMRAVEKDDFFDLTFEGKIYKTLKARDLYDLIMEATYNRNEPGVLFSGNMDRNNPISYLGKLTCTNPCLHGSSLMLTKGGLRKIETLVGETVTFWNGIKWVTGGVTYTGVKPVYEMILSNGMSLKATLDHRVECFDNNSSFECHVENSIGKKVTRFTGSPWDGERSPLSNEYLICLGFTFGDGSYHIASNRYKYVYIGKEDQEVENLFKTIGEELPEESRYDKRIISLEFANKVSLLNFPKVSLPERTLSEEILRLPPDQICLFLKGMYSANGSVISNDRITYKSTCRTLIDQLQVLLMALEIKSYVTTNKSTNVEFENGVYECKESYDLNITSKDVPIFLEKIGFVQEYKQDSLDWSDKRYGRRIDPTVKEVRYFGEEKVYDFTEPETHWGFVNGLKVHNCGEIGGIASLTTVCLLGSVNLTQYVILNELCERTFDWDSYIADVKVFTRMLDNVNDLSYISLPSYQWATDNLRQFGMGVNGLGSVLMMLGIPYNSQAAVDFTKKVCQLKENMTWQTSALLAKEKGTFQGYIKEKFENTEYFKSDRLSEETKNMLRKYGARNAKTTTNPPLGNTSVITGTSNGIEPVFNLEYERVVICKGWPNGLNTDNIKSLFEKFKGTDHEYWRDTYEGKVYHYEPHNRGLCEVSVVRDYGYQWLLDNLPNVDHSSYLITTGDLKIEDHLRIQEVVQYYNNQSVSKCLMIGQKVETDKGLISIEDFCDEKYTEEGFYKAKKLNVYGSDGSLVPVIKSYYGGKKPCYTIKFNNGISINAGENHKFKNPEGFIKTKDLKVGDYIVFENMSFVHGTGGLKIDFDLKSHTLHYYKDITLPETLSEDLALFLGMLASDGGWSWPSVRLTEKKNGVGKLYKSLAKKLFNIDRIVSCTDKRNGVKTHSINSVPLCRYIESLMGKSTANQKRVPEQILNGSEAEKKAFIKGLSLDGYYVEQKMSFVPYCGVSEELAKGLHQICLQIFGYDTYYFEKTSTVKLKKGLVLDYKTYGVSIWKNGEPSNSKYDLAIEEHKNKKGRFKNCIVYVPFSDIEKIPRTKGTENLYSIRGIYRRKSPYILRKTADTLGLNYTKVVQVSSIEYLGEQEVFDIEVGNNHEYLVSNIVTHNTANLPNKYPFDDFKSLYLEAWKRGLNGFTTYRDGTMESVISNIKKTENTRGIITKDIKLPNSFLNGPTSVIKRQGFKFYIHFSYLPDDTNKEFPIVMWIYTNARYVGEDLKICNKAARNLGKLALSKGIDEKIVTCTLEKAKSDYPHNRLGRLVSLNLRHNVPREDILAALMGIDGDNISTLVTAVRKFLSATLRDGTRLKGVKCDNPDCTGTRLNVVLESGCKKCLDCGASSCGA